LARRRDGTTVPIDLSVTTAEPLRQPIRILGVRDISARKQAEESRNRLEVQLRQAQKLEAIGQLAAGIAHEINTPVQYVGDNTRFLRDSFTEINTLCRAHERLLQAAHAGPVDPNLLAELEAQTAEVDLAYLGEEIPLAITQSLEGLGRIASIVRAMKDFSHPGSVEKTPADLNKALLSTVEISRNEWKYHAELETELDPALPLVPCLPGELNQVFLNIIVNAAHAIAQSLAEHPGHDKGRILISTRLAGDWAEVAIADSGTGVPEAIRSRIFDPFFTTKEVGKGSGQGLAIAYAVVVEKHAGSIEVENLPDGGARFVIRLPLQAAGEP
jgi:signal transduction histidine kinase